MVVFTPPYLIACSYQETTLSHDIIHSLSVYPTHLTPRNRTLSITHSNIIVSEPICMITEEKHLETFVTDRSTPILSQADIDGIETFLFFIGWPRSGHSIIGSMLDAHPNVIIAHEYTIFSRLIEDEENQLSNRSTLFNRLYKNSYKMANIGSRTSSRNKKGYTLSMEGTWQGRFTNLKVIGDKSGGRTTKMYGRNHQQIKELYQQLKATVKVPVKVVQVIRLIATQTLYMGCPIPITKINATATHRYTNFRILRRAITTLLKDSRALNNMVHDIGLSPLQVHSEDLIAQPVETISNICQFLNLDCSKEYLQMCAEKTFTKSSASRYLVTWDLSDVSALKQSIMKFPFFQRYNNTEGLVYV